MSRNRSIRGERAKRNPFTASAAGGRALSALQLPLFLVHPPSGYGVLTTTGRKTGKTRRRCVRATRSGDHVYVVAIKGAKTGWARNALANPDVRLRIGGGAFPGRAREVRGGTEGRMARETYCESVHWFDHLTWLNWRRGRPTAEKIRELLRGWFDDGQPIVVELARRSSRFDLIEAASPPEPADRTVGRRRDSGSPPQGPATLPTVEDPVSRYRAASEAGDIEAVMATLAPDVEIVSPVLGRMVFRGQRDARILLSAVYGSLRGLRWTEQVGDGKHRVVLGETRVGPVKMTDAMVFELAPDGRIRRVSPHLRPWLALTLFAALLGPKMARHPERFGARSSVEADVPRPGHVSRAAVD